MIHAGVPVQNRFMEKRDLVCLFAIDFVMSFLDMTGELAQLGGDKVISVTNCKDSLITAYTGFVTANLQLANSTLPDFEGIINQNRVTPEFLTDYPDCKPDPADALDVERVGFNSVNPLDMQFMTEMMGNAEFMSDMRNLYLTDESAAMPQGKREEIVMGYVLRYGPRCKQAFAEGRDPTEEEMDRDAEVVNSIVYHLIESVRGAGAPAPEAPAQASEAAAPAEGEAKAGCRALNRSDRLKRASTREKAESPRGRLRFFLASCGLRSRGASPRACESGDLLRSLPVEACGLRLPQRLCSRNELAKCPRTRFPKLTDAVPALRLVAEGVDFVPTSE